MNLIRSSIAARVVIAFACVLLVVIALGIAAVSRLGVVNDHAADVRDNWLPSVGLQGKQQSESLKKVVTTFLVNVKAA